MKPWVLALMLLASTVNAARAQDEADDKRSTERRGPPEAALEACSSAEQGDPCAFEGRRGETVEGTCETPGEKPLACRPTGTKRSELFMTS